MTDINWKKDMRGEALLQSGNLKVTRKGLEGVNLFKKEAKGITPWSYIEKIIVSDKDVTLVSRKPSECLEGSLIIKRDDFGAPIINHLKNEPLFDLEIKNIFAPVFKKDKSGKDILINKGMPELLQDDEVVKMKFSFPKPIMNEDNGDAIRVWRDFYTKIQIYQRQSKMLGRIENENNPELPAIPVYSLNIPILEYTEDAISVLKSTEDSQYFINNNNGAGIETPKYKKEVDLYRYVYNKDPDLRIAVEV